MATRAPRRDTPLWRETMRAGALRSSALFGALGLFVGVLLTILALTSYRASDPAFNTAAGGPVRNLIGAPGAFLSDALLWLAGPPIVLLLPLILVCAARLWRGDPVGPWVKMLRGASIGIALMALALTLVSGDAVAALPAGWGGVIGLLLAAVVGWGTAFIGDPQAILWTTRGLCALVALAGVVLWAKSLDLDVSERDWLFRRRRQAESEGDYAPVAEPAMPLPKASPRAKAVLRDRPAPVIAERALAPSAAKPKPAQQAQLDFRDSYDLPGIDLLTPRRPRPAGRSTRPRSSAMRGCSNRYSTISTSRDRSSRCAPGRS